MVKKRQRIDSSLIIVAVVAIVSMAVLVSNSSDNLTGERSSFKTNKDQLIVITLPTQNCVGESGHWTTWDYTLEFNLSCGDWYPPFEAAYNDSSQAFCDIACFEEFTTSSCNGYCTWGTVGAGFTDQAVYCHCAQLI